MQQDDHWAVGPCRDRPRSALDRHDRLEVERSLDLERLGLGQKLVERLDGERAGLALRVLRADWSRTSSASIAATAAASGPSCPLARSFR